MYCGNCGTKMADDACFCPSCGAKMQEPPARPTQTSQTGQPAGWTSVLEKRPELTAAADTVSVLGRNVKRQYQESQKRSVARYQADAGTRIPERTIMMIFAGAVIVSLFTMILPWITVVQKAFGMEDRTNFNLFVLAFADVDDGTAMVLPPMLGLPLALLAVKGKLPLLAVAPMAFSLVSPIYSLYLCDRIDGNGWGYSQHAAMAYGVYIFMAAFLVSLFCLFAMWGRIRMDKKQARLS